MISRLKQGYMYFFSNFDKKNEAEVKKKLSPQEFKIFSQMSDYDKVHSFLLYNRVKKNEILKEDPIYLKLALLHDCGKGKVGLLRRMKKVIIGDKNLEKHPEIAYEKLKHIDKELAMLCKSHHLIEYKTEYEKKIENNMQIFQGLDDE